MTTIRTLELRGHDPAAWGEQHGESFRDDIRAIAAIRMELTLAKTDLGTRDNVLALARHHLPVLQQFDAALFTELNGIARGAKLSLEEVVVLNHYTDLRDLTQKDLARLNAGESDGCSAMFVQHGNTRVLGQTWDMHGSAEPYALLITVPGRPDDAPFGSIPGDKTNAAGIPTDGKTLVFSITGCLGMTGLTSWGNALTINNLTSLDATVGVVWSAVVRKALRQKNAKAMRDLIMTSRIGSGRHYVLADDHDVFGIETSGTKKKLIHEGAGTYFHTNHCVDPEMIPTARIMPGSTTLQRYQTLTTLVQARAPQSAREVFNAFESVGLPQVPGKPHEPATCGALVMDITARAAIACQGIPGADADGIVLEVA